MNRGRAVADVTTGAVATRVPSQSRVPRSQSGSNR